MAFSHQLARWEQEIAEMLPHLSRPQRHIVSAWSLATLLKGRCGVTTVSAYLADVDGGTPNSWRQRLREWCYGASEKKGSYHKGVKRSEIDVTSCFAPLLRWILQRWDEHDHRLVLVLDGTTLSDDLSIAAISVVYQQQALPVAWHMVPKHASQSWQPIWQDLLEALRPAIPADWMVLVMTDAGLYAPWLFETIHSFGWHPMMRLSQKGMVQREGHSEYEPLRDVVPNQGQYWSGSVGCFKGKDAHIDATLLAGHGQGYDDPWLILTDLPAEQANVAWYSMRFWIEPGFKSLKSGCWHWDETKMRQAHRAERQWLMLALTTLLSVSQGTVVEEEEKQEHERDQRLVPPTHISRRTKKKKARRENSPSSRREKRRSKVC